MSNTIGDTFTLDKISAQNGNITLTDNVVFGGNLDISNLDINNVYKITTNNIYGGSKLDIHDNLNMRSAGGKMTFESGIVIGDSSTFTTVANSVVIGKNASGTGGLGPYGDSIAIGFEARAESSNMAFGTCAQAGFAGNSMAIGTQSRAAVCFDCIAIGDNATVLGGGGALYNSIAFGKNVAVTSSNTIRLGDASITSIQGQVGFMATSDARDKCNINQIHDGLDFIKTLKPVSFNFDPRECYEDQTPNGSKCDNTPRVGFLAQDIAESQSTLDVNHLNIVEEKLHSYVLNGVTSNLKQYMINTDHLIPVLVNAIKDLNGIISYQGNLIAEQTNINANLIARIEALENP